MALCGGPGLGALALPSELIVHIFSFLPHRDRLRASAVCSRWRECLFYPSLWTELCLRVPGGGGSAPGEEAPRLEFLMRKFGSFVRELQLEFSPLEGRLPGQQGDGEPGVELELEVEDRAEEGVEVEETSQGQTRLPGRWRDALGSYLEQVLCVLSSIRNNRSLRRLSVYGDSFVEEGLLDTACLSQVHQGAKRIKEIQHLFSEVLSNSRQMTWLSSCFVPGLLTPGSLSSLSAAGAAALEHLSLLDGQLALVPAPADLARLRRLHSLALHFCDFTSEMCRLLAAPERAPLRRLSLLLDGADDASALAPGGGSSHLEGAAGEEAWRALARSSAGLRVYVMALEAGGATLLRALKPGMPLERLHLDSYAALVSDGALELISRQYKDTLCHFLLTRDDGGGFPDLSSNRNEDPLVLLAWRCKHLSTLVIHGYTVWSHNLVAISRLRPHLRVLAVSEESIEFDPEQAGGGEEGGGDPVHHLVKEVSLGLGRAWRPTLDSSAALGEPTQHFHRTLQAFSMETET